MKYFASLFLLLLTAVTVNAQTYEIGGLIGGSNYIGDIGNSNYIFPTHTAVGGIVKWNRSTRHSFRGSVMIARIDGDDSESDNSRRKQRGYSFNNVVKEASLGIEYTFWEYDVHNQQLISTPYLYTGLTVFGYSELYKNPSGEIEKYDNGINFAIPMVIGFKAAMSRRMKIGFEVGARYTFTDNLDGSNPKDTPGDDENLKFGNTDSNDWYVFTGITVTFAFGRKPCYCNF